MTRRRWLIVSAASGIFLAVAAGAVPFLNLRLTHYVESDRFRARLENETAKGLHFSSGDYALGVTREYLDWLPKPDEIFTRERGGYLWATVHLSGTIQEPKQDLSPRIVELFKQSPGAYLGLLLRELEAWLKRIFNGE